ncbi:hypothetical protein [Ruegeria sp. R14_0]|uniref:hypothetical protein n=1 Tax=Ruegeria sp. R14_0 TaxID=2821100 RepID=UPI001ADAA092|nr:hypothetical protein [Ruegeria sp. R14_0]MBO9444786.1 hypothetical protein [Ruegeria sp. R14_0]
MNMNRIIDMIIRQIMRRVVNKGIDKGFDMAGRMGKPKQRSAVPHDTGANDDSNRQA